MRANRSVDWAITGSVRRGFDVWTQSVNPDRFIDQKKCVKEGVDWRVSSTDERSVDRQTLETWHNALASILIVVATLLFMLHG